MDKDLQELLSFHKTGEKLSFEQKTAGSLTPALLVNYVDLSKIRHDYPILLVRNNPEQPISSLSSIVNRLLQQTTPQGIGGERIRKNVLQIESEIRMLILKEGKGSLSKLWDQAEKHLLSRANSTDKKQLQATLYKAKSHLNVDGELIPCDDETALKVMTHIFDAFQQKKNSIILNEIHELCIKLENILETDFLKSKKAKSSQALKAQVGLSFESEIDFDSMSNMLSTAFSEETMPESRKSRIQSALSVLRSQKFFAVARDEKKSTYSFIVDSCTEALKEYQSRLPEMVDFIKSIKIAQLEIGNKYREDKHDSYFSQFDQNSLNSQEIDLFPYYLICMTGEQNNDTDKTKLIEILSSDIPAKILYQIDDVFDKGMSNVWNQQISNIAMGLGNAYILQTTSSNLFQTSEEISAGIQYSGPALFSIFSGSKTDVPNLPPYLTSASAMQSRVFPTFVYNPDAGESWADRFNVMTNPQPEQNWPSSTFIYEDQDLQQVTENLAFTYLDFAATDKRFLSYFMSVPESKWHEKMIPVSDYLKMQNGAATGQIPYILMVDQDNNLHKVIVQQGLINEARKNQAIWRNLQELGGINNSHALKLLQTKKEQWDKEKQKEIEELKSQLKKQSPEPIEMAETAVVKEQPKEVEVVVEEGPVEDAYIETARCNTCNECITKNDRMFAYNENKQAYIKDISAGTYRDLVEAAEVCKVAIIHPGKPKNPNEPDIDELIKRAEPFN